MTITVNAITETEFKTRLRNLLGVLEGNKQQPYRDNAIPSHPTIGIGFDLTNPTVASKVFDAMGISTTSTLRATLTTAINNSIGKSDSKIQTALDAAYGASFQMTPAQIEAAFNEIAKPYIDTAKTSGLGYSDELVALTSLAFNGVYGPGTKAALNLPDPYEARAQAWYQIRYVHVEGQNDKRRYAEAAIFGLYEPGTAMSEDAARGVYRMYTEHSDAMIDHDAAYIGLLGGANADLAAAGFGARVANLEDSLQSAADYLINKYGEGQRFSPLNIWVAKSTGSTIQGDHVNGNLLIGDIGADSLTGGSGNDGLVGGKGSDTLDGGRGNDTLNGGGGADQLQGGSGFDTYIADSLDVITDSDGGGVVKLNGLTLRGGKRKESDPPNTYKGSAGEVYVLQGSTLSVNGLKINGFKKGDLGIRLEEDPPIRQKTRTASTLLSPIVLDLDGDGVETLSMDGGTYFDHASDGFAEQTSWVAPDDGLLVRDLNGNGSIDNGRELFGSETQLARGYTAANGFEALAELDTNGDGVIDTRDAVFAELRVWKDVNRDGRTDAGELLSLAEAGVHSINVNYSNSSFIDANGNTHKQVGSYTTTDGQTRAATDVWVKTDALYSLPTEWVDAPEDIAALPDAQGYGKMRSLHQAMAMDGTGQLKKLVIAFTQATTHEERAALVTQIIYRWSGVQDVDPTSRINSGWGNTIGDARRLEALEEFLGEEWRQYGWGANPARDAGHMLNEAYGQLEALVYGQLMSQSHLGGLFQSIAYHWDEELDGPDGDLSIVANSLAIQIETDRETGLTELDDFLYSLKGMGLLNGLDVVGFKAMLQPLGADVAQTMDAALAGWTPSKKFDVPRGGDLDDILIGQRGNDRLFGRGGKDTLIGGAGNDVLDGGADNDELRGGIGSDTYRFGRGDGNDTIIEDSWIAGETDRIEFKAGITPGDVRLERVRVVNGWQVSDDLKITIRDTGETLTVKNPFYWSDRYAIEQTAFADGTLWDAEAIKSRSLLGEAGDDELRGFNERDDLLVGGAGNDQLEGGSGSDTYRFGLGDGQDVINEGDTTGEDRVELTAGITPADVTVRWTLQGDMAVTLPDGSKLTVRGQAAAGASPRGIEQLRFADGTMWDRSELALRALAVTGGDDAIVDGYQDDVLDGGIGNDQFQDLGGDDTYRFGIGDGQDVIEDTYGRVLFKPGIRQNDVAFTLDGNDLIVTLGTNVAAPGDAVRIKDWLNNGQRIDRFDFDNGARLSVNDVLTKLNVSEGAEILYGSPGADTLTGTGKDSTLYGREGNDVLSGGAGSDQLYGEAGDDVLDGGADRDQLYGGRGNNSYLVTAGMGLDNAISADLAVANDTVLFAAGIRPESISVQLGTASGGNAAGDVGYYDLVIGIGGNDALVLRNENWNDLGQSALQHFRFDDGTEWTLSELIARADSGTVGWQNRFAGEPSNILGSQADDDISDYTGQSVVVQARGNNDNVHLEAGNDQVSAGSGDDDIYTGAGNDLIAGETGNDLIDSGDGDDVVVFNYGDGRDTLQVGDGVDTLSFGATVTPAMLSVALNRDGRVVLFVDGGTGGSITLDNTRIDDLPGDLERIQFIDADGKTQVFDLAGWLQGSAGALLSATTETPLDFDGTGFELTGTVAPAGELEAVAYAQSGDLFAAANLTNNSPTDGDDVLYGTRTGDALDAGAGNDIALGLAGDDVILGGDGNDVIHGGDGDDVLDGNAGNDVIYGGWGADQLTSGTGNDQLFGEWGGDTYVYQPGHGEVIIDDDHRVLNWSGGWGGGEGGWDGGEGGSGGWYGGAIVDDAPNILTFGPGIRPEDLRYSEQNGDLVIEFANQPGDRVILRGYEPGRATQTRSVDIIRFADGTEIVAENIEPTGRTGMVGDEGGQLNGTAFADTLLGGDGDDVLNGQGGGDRLVGGAGSDTYRIYKQWGSQPSEVIIAETWRAQDSNRIEITGAINADDLSLEFDGSDLLLRLAPEGDAIRFAGFDPRAPGMQAPVSEISLPWQGITFSFDELLARGVRYGDYTQDIYDVNIGDGEVLIDDIAAPDAGNVLRFGPGIDPETLRNRLSFEADSKGGYVVLISYGIEDDGGDVVRLSGFDPDDVLGTRAIDRFEFADGTIWDYATLVANGFSVFGDNASNDIGGSQLADRVYGHDGDDVIDGKSGVNELHGEGGNDILIGGDQVDGYFFQHGDGVDTIIDGPSDNFIVFGPGVSKTDITVAWDGDALVLHYGLGDEIRIPDFYAKTLNGTPPVTAIRFDDGEMTSIPSLISASPIAQLAASELPVATEDAIYRHSIALSNFDQPGAFGVARVLSLRQADGSPLPAWLTFDAERGLLRGTPVNEDVGQLNLLVEAWGDYGPLATQGLLLSVNNTNDAPEIADAIADQRATEDAPFSFTLPADSFRDVDVDDVLSYTAMRANGDPLPTWLAFDAQTGSFAGTPANGDVGVVQLAVTATDLAGKSASQLFSLTVANTNDAPAAAGTLGNQHAIEDTAFSFTLPADALIDVDAGDVLSYSATLDNGEALPTWLSFDVYTQTFAGTPTNGDVGSLQVRVTATDLAGASSSQTFLLDVANVNDAPVVVADTNNVTEDNVLSASGNVLSNDSDVDTGTTLQVAAPGTYVGTYGSLVLNANGSYTYTLSNGNSAVQSLAQGAKVTDSFAYAASDGFTSTASTLTLTITGTNDAPTLVAAITDQVVNAGSLYTYQVSASAFADVDAGTTLAYTAMLSNGQPLPSWLTFNAMSRTFSGTPLASNVGQLSLMVVASDSSGAAASDVFVLTVKSSEIVGTEGCDNLVGTGGDDVIRALGGNDVIVSNGGNDTLDGGTGADCMNGGAGNDTYVVDNTGDVVTENAGEGTDLVQSSITYTLGNNVENLTLTGTTAINGAGNTLDNVLTGNSANNTLTGAAGNDRLDGGTGADTMIGGTGNDTYVVDNTGDVVTENAGEGTDLVQSSITYTLSANVENLTLTGTAAINGTGNTLNNILTGNAADNTLNGGTGADTMIGGAGNDTYVVDNTGDVVTENVGEGTDLVQSGITYTLGNNVENLTLTGTTAINGTGNTLDNVLVGNSAANKLTGGAGNDTLNGGAGADTMVGGTGNDTYVVDSTTDIVTENASEGTDLIQSSVTYTLSANVENLTLTGTAAINGTGNALNNVLTGNSAANTLDGGAGNDTLQGGLGADTLTGGTGNDTYLFGRGDGADIVQENDATAGNTDIVQFLSGVANDQLWFRRLSGTNDLEVSVIGSADKMTVKNWYLGSQYHVEQFKTADGNKTLSDTKVQALVDAMAVFAPPSAGQTTLPANYQTALNPVIAANWT